MDDVSLLDAVIRPGTIVMGLAIYILTFFIRRIFEVRWPSLKKAVDANAPGLTYLTPAARWWNEVVLYAVPVVLGMLTALSHDEFLFGPMKDSSFGRSMFGGGVAWFSSIIYKTVKKLLMSKLGGGKSMPPGESMPPGQSMSPGGSP